MNSAVRAGVLCLVCVVTTTPGPRPQSAPERKPARILSAEQFRQGVRLFTDKIFELHPKPYEFFSKESWRREIDRLCLRRTPIGEAEAFVEITELVGNLHSSHSWTAVDDDSLLFSASMPLRFCRFSDGLYVRAAAPELAKLVGAKVLFVGGVPVEEAWGRLLRALAGDTEAVSTTAAQVYLQIPEYLRVLGLAPADGTATFELEFPGGRRESVSVAALPHLNFSETWYASHGFATLEGWVEPEGAARALWLRRRNEAFWYEYLPDRRTVFVQFNRATTDPENPWNPEKDRYRPFIQELFDFIARNPVERLVIDLRHNNGGFSSLWQPLVHAIIRSDKVDRAGRLFVLIGRVTESAAVAWAAKLESETMALFAGEAVASPPNFYNDPAGARRETFHVPGSAINYRVARQLEQWSSPFDHRRTIFPDLPAPFSWPDFASGRDPALEAALAVTQEVAAALFVTPKGESVLEKPYAHYTRKSQAGAWPNR